MPSMLPDSCGKRLDNARRELVELAFANVTIDVLRQILDDDLAAELLAEEAHVGADDRTEIEEHRLRARAQARDEARQHLRRVHGRIGRTDIGVGVFLTATREQVGERHRRDEGQRSRVGMGEGAPADPRSLRSPRVSARRLEAEPAPAGPPATPPFASPSRLAVRPCAACPRCRGSARLRQSPHAAR